MAGDLSEAARVCARAFAREDARRERSRAVFPEGWQDDKGGIGWGGRLKEIANDGEGYGAGLSLLLADIVTGLCRNNRCDKRM